MREQFVRVCYVEFCFVVVIVVFDLEDGQWFDLVFLLFNLGVNVDVIQCEIGFFIIMSVFEENLVVFVDDMMKLFEFFSYIFCDLVSVEV